MLIAKKKHSKLKNTKVKDSVPEVPDQRDILAITEGQFGKPVIRKGRFINANYPPDDATEAELEAIERFWGDPDDAVPLRDMKINHSRNQGGQMTVESCSP